MAEFAVGDRITFRAVCRWNSAKATRVINGFYNGRPTVAFGGYRDFVVRLDEILTHHPAEA